MKIKDLRQFFCERMVELFNWNVIDSYRVKSHNTFSSIKELLDVLKGWRDGNIKVFETVEWTAEETIERVKSDDIIDFLDYTKELLLSDLESLKKNGKTNKDLYLYTIFILERCVSENRDCYLYNMYEAIEAIVYNEQELTDDDFKSIADKLNKLCDSLACELLNEGFSHRHLFNNFNKLLDNIDHFDEEFPKFKSTHGHNSRSNEYEVVFKLNGGYNRRLFTIEGFSEEIPDDFVPEDKVTASVTSFLAKRGNWVFYYCQVNAMDSVSAIGKAKEKLELVLDRAALGFSRIDISSPRAALVKCHYQSDVVILLRNFSVLDVSYADDNDTAQRIIGILDSIYENQHISEEVKDRLKSSFRHLRMGNIETDEGQRLVNYWVALEFLFSSPKASESTMSRLEKNMINILLCGYARKRMEYMNSALVKNGSLDETDKWWSIEDEQLKDTILSQERQIDRYHLQEMKARLLNKRSDAKNYLTMHENHLKWHIYRMYRYRNRLVHEAAILPGIDNITRDLRYYLVYILNQLIGFLTDATIHDLTIDNFFYDYQQKRKIIENAMSKKGEEGKDWLDVLSGVNIYQDLMKTSE